MRWFLCGLAFTGLVGLAVFTVAQRASNVRCRKHIEAAFDQASIQGIEHELLLHRMRQATGKERLAARWIRMTKRLEARAE